MCGEGDSSVYGGKWSVMFNLLQPQLNTWGGVRILCRWPLSGDTVLVFTRHIILLTISYGYNCTITRRYLHVTKPKLEDRCQYPTFHLINQFNMVFIFVLTGMCWIHKRSLWQNTIANVSINSLLFGKETLIVRVIDIHLTSEPSVKLA